MHFYEQKFVDFAPNFAIFTLDFDICTPCFGVFLTKVIHSSETFFVPKVSFFVLLQFFFVRAAEWAEFCPKSVGFFTTSEVRKTTSEVILTTFELVLTTSKVVFAIFKPKKGENRVAFSSVVQRYNIFCRNPNFGFRRTCKFGRFTLDFAICTPWKWGFCAFLSECRAKVCCEESNFF